MGRDVRFFKNRCPVCSNDVGVPLLGEFSYGEFIYQTVCGRSYAYVPSFSEPAWEKVSQILQDHAGIRLEENNSEINVYQNIMVRCADSINGKSFTTNFPLCPKCGGRITSYNNDVIMFDQYLDNASWKGFMQLLSQNQIDTVLQLLKKETDGNNHR